MYTRIGMDGEQQTRPSPLSEKWARKVLDLKTDDWNFFLSLSKSKNQVPTKDINALVSLLLMK